METASIVVDIQAVRCGNCKVALPDELATQCPVCGAIFDRIVSNHVGLAGKLRKKRLEANPPSFKVISEQLLTDLTAFLNGDPDNTASAVKAIQEILDHSPTVTDVLENENLDQAMNADQKASRLVPRR